ncbi:CHAT domain-containing protein [Desulfonema limicola]|uniref:CHAT domain-containing protein n=1 Tax=Desulfonema limicola TaxID=45656 RepID=A0A975GEZ4_9BACT|nr:CHAT domain-containing protein [Desulfonema limicola]QTA78703.1 CHAT domain-containing protein [Desulfonema limicola]
MIGKSSAVRKQPIFPIGIILEREKYRIEGKHDSSFERSARDEWLKEWSGELLEPFRKLSNLVIKYDTCDFSATEKSKQFADQYTEQLITLGRQAFNQFFEDHDAYEFFMKRISLFKKIGSYVSPFFWSREIPYPWEVFYPREIGKDEDPVSFFWGMSYPLGRNLTKDPFDYHVEEQQAECDMLFGLHKELTYARQKEWPGLKELVIKNSTDAIHVLGGDVGLCLAADNTCNDTDLLKYLFNANHNMVHFACHCKRKEKDDFLKLSWIEGAINITDAEISGNIASIRLSPRTFLNEFGTFKRQQPLVFLNACQTTGEIDDVTLDFNLPRKFIISKAAAVIATMCPIPDLFAADFAHKFYEFFLKENMEIGEALRAARWFFWEKYNNPLGLAYGLYSSPFYKVAKPMSQGGLI